MILPVLDSNAETGKIKVDITINKTIEIKPLVLKIFFMYSTLLNLNKKFLGLLYFKQKILSIIF